MSLSLYLSTLWVSGTENTVNFTLIYFSTGLAIIRLCPMILLDKSTWDGHTIVGVIGTTSRLEIGMGKFDYVRGGVGGLGG